MRVCVSDFYMPSSFVSSVRDASISNDCGTSGLLEPWLVQAGVKYHGNILILMLLNQWLALTMLRTTGPRTRVIKAFFTLGARALVPEHWCPSTGARARAQNAAMFRLLVPKMYVCSHSINRARAHCIQTAGIATCMHFVFDIAV